jgi:hypothetical protein
MSDINVQFELESGVDALYVTRPQKERFADGEENREHGDTFPVVDRKLLRDKAFRKTLVMHPLPRVDELAYEMDADPRSKYFAQAAHGVPVRMALITLLLGIKEVAPSPEDITPAIGYPRYEYGTGARCSNPRCVSVQKTEIKYLKPDFKIVNRKPLTLRCVYCEHGFEPKYVASTEWHEGKTATKIYHDSDSRWARKIRPENLIVFNSEDEARAQGFGPSHDVKERHSESHD